MSDQVPVRPLLHDLLECVEFFELSDTGRVFALVLDDGLPSFGLHVFVLSEAGCLNAQSPLSCY